MSNGTFTTRGHTGTPVRILGRTPEVEDPVKSGRHWAGQVREAWDPCILALDGGGIRGYSSLLILRALMHEVWIWEKRLQDNEQDREQGDKPHESHGSLRTGNLPEEEDLLPCHYFDFMNGTSTGGLISIMLGRLRMTIGECLKEYQVVGEKLFGHRRSRIPLSTKYHHEPLEEEVKAIVNERSRHEFHPWDHKAGEQDAGPGAGRGARLGARQDAVQAAESNGAHQATAREEPKTWDPEAPRICQTCCLTAIHNKSVIQAYLLRSYPHYYSESTPSFITPYNEGADPLAIWQVTRATSAAPFYFDMLRAEVNGRMMNCKDGGIRENNPSGAAYVEFRSLYERHDKPALLLSIGTGRADQSSDGFAAAWPGPWAHVPVLKNVLQKLEKFSIVGSLLVKFTESEKQHQDMLLIAEGMNTWYKRLNVDAGLERMPLDDWRRGPRRSADGTAGRNVPGGATLNKMDEETSKYLTRAFDPAFDTYAPPSIMLAQAAEKLVRQRRAREREGGPRWQVFIQERP